MKKLLILCVFMLFLPDVRAQGADKSIVKIIDDLTIEWDEDAEKMMTYDGLKEYCRVMPYRRRTISLLDKIHHYDTVLYRIVRDKVEVGENPEAQATLKDIDKLEQEYTTASFKRFLHKECNSINEIENNLKAGSKEYLKEVGDLEKELSQYIREITRQIDVIDEHVHHLEGLDN